MIVPSLTVPNLSNFYSLALFICQIFMNGPFQFGHILYDPNILNDQLLTEIASICPVAIPWQTDDITNPSSSPISNLNDRTDHIFQLIFFDPKHLAKQIDHHKDQLCFYRIFIFLDDIEVKNSVTSLIGKLNPILSSSPLIVHYDSKSDSVLVNLVSNSESGKSIDYSDEFPEFENGKKINGEQPEHLFNQTFAKYDRMRTIAIGVVVLFWRVEDYSKHESLVPQLGNIYFSNYFYETLKASHINMSCETFSNATAPKETQILEHKHRKYYNELSLQYSAIKDKKL